MCRGGSEGETGKCWENRPSRVEGPIPGASHILTPRSYRQCPLHEASKVFRPSLTMKKWKEVPEGELPCQAQTITFNGLRVGQKGLKIPLDAIEEGGGPLALGRTVVGAR